MKKAGKWYSRGKAKEEDGDAAVVDVDDEAAGGGGCGDEVDGARPAGMEPERSGGGEVAAVVVAMAGVGAGEGREEGWEAEMMLW